MPEMHLRHPGFTYSACEPFTNNKERMQKFVETTDSWYVYQDELDKACFQHDMAYKDFKDLAKTTAPDKTLHDKTFNIAKSPKYDGYQRHLASIVYVLIKKLLRLVLNIIICDNSNWQKNYTNQLLENLVKEKYNHLL